MAGRGARVTDTLTPARRSALMARIRSKGTRPEAAVARILRRLKIRFRRHRKGLPGTPDFWLPGLRAAVFVNGCFWHGCPRHWRPPKSNSRFWREKVRRNRLRDGRAAAALRRMGIIPWTVWEHDLKGAT